MHDDHFASGSILYQHATLNPISAHPSNRDAAMTNDDLRPSFF
jgi:hypothetical protein